MLSNIVCLVLLGILAVATGIPQYIGMTQRAPGSPIEMFGLSTNISRQAEIAKIAVRETEAVQDNDFRCRPGYQSCVVITNDVHGTGRLYNISAADGALLGVATLPGAVLHNLNLDVYTGTAWTIASYGPVAASLIAIDNTGAVTQLVNLSSVLRAGDEIESGSMTSCSSDGRLWISLRSKIGPDRVVRISAPHRSIEDVFSLSMPTPRSLWALCIRSTKFDVFAGTVQVGDTISYSYIKDNGYQIVNEAVVPSHSPPYELSKLLAAAPNPNEYLTVLYPQGTVMGAPANGIVAIGDYTTGKRFKLSTIDFYLVGAAWVH